MENTPHLSTTAYGNAWDARVAQSVPGLRMARDFDRSQPGPAGLMFDPSQLTEFGQARERAARAALEHWCVSCGQPASHGFGCFAHTDGVWACAEADCRAVAEARAAAPSLMAAE